MSRAFSYPKEKLSALLLENIHPAAVELFKKEGYQVELLPGALSENELLERIPTVSVLGIRSGTQVSEATLKKAKRLLAVGAFCIGTNQIDLAAAAGHGVAVFNAPFSNTRSVVELAIGAIIMLYRRAFDRSVALHRGEWDKSAKGSHEIRQKKLGIVGYGNIGSQLSVLAESLGMKVYFYDRMERLALGNATKCATLEELLEVVDVVTLHVDGRAENKNFFGKNEFQKMREGALFLNLSRGSLVDLDALAAVVSSGRLAGAAVDVFPNEPKGKGTGFTTPLQGVPNVILTPHVGGSTVEAQEAIGRFVAERLIRFVNEGSTLLSVNMPAIELPQLKNAHRFLHIHKNVPGMLAKINSLLAEHAINIEGQYLGTKGDVGYAITDVGTDYGKEIVDALKAIPETIRFRTLY